MVVYTSINGEQVSKEPDCPGRVRGLPEVIKVGPKISGKVMDSRVWRGNIRLDFSRQGKTVDNACIESFNHTARVECMNDNWFSSLRHAR